MRFLDVNWGFDDQDGLHVLQYFVFDFIGPQVHLFDKIIKISVSIPLQVVVLGARRRDSRHGERWGSSAWLAMPGFRRINMGR